MAVDRGLLDQPVAKGLQRLVATFGHCMTCSKDVVILHKFLKGQKIACIMRRPS